MLVDIIMYGAAGLGGFAVFNHPRIRHHTQEMKKALPSKRLRGTPDDLDPTATAFALMFPKMIVNIDKVYSGDYGRSVDYNDGGDLRFKIRANGPLYINKAVIENGNRYTLSLRKGDYSIEQEYRVSDPFYETIVAFLLQLQKLYMNKEKQKAKEAKDAAGLKMPTLLTESEKPLTDAGDVAE